MALKAREYRTKADRCDRQARKTRDPQNREWQLVFARVYRILAESGNEVAALSVAA